jgi:hypothetical protein
MLRSNSFTDTFLQRRSVEIGQNVDRVAQFGTRDTLSFTQALKIKAFWFGEQIAQKKSVLNKKQARRQAIVSPTSTRLNTHLD